MSDSQCTSLFPRLQLIKTFLKNRDWPTKSSIRWYIHGNVNGFSDACVKRLGKRVFIDVPAFEAWLAKNAI